MGRCEWGGVNGLTIAIGESSVIPYAWRTRTSPPMWFKTAFS